MTYYEKTRALIQTVPNTIIDWSIERKRGKPPTQAFSEFLTNREQGDWAESLILKAINALSKNYVAVQYGKSENIIAGEDGFEPFYEQYQDELETIGKRPDILLFSKKIYSEKWNHDISNFSKEDLDNIVPLANSGIEVRSSAFLVDEYNQFMQQRKAELTQKVLHLKEKLLVNYREILSRKEGRKRQITLSCLDPAFGLGVFARAIRKTNKECSIKGFEIDKNIFQQAQNYFVNENNTSIILKDYMFNDWENRYDGIICNPPYFKFHDYENKTTLKEIEDKLGLKLNGFTNLYTLFLLKSAYQLNAGGRAAYIIPSEFLNSDYGKLVKAYLIKNKFLRYIIIFDFEENIFDAALTTASILLFANDKEKSEVEFINIKTLDKLFALQNKFQSYPKIKSENAIAFSKLNPEIKWRAYYQKQNAARFKNLVPFSNFGKVVRGIATGANEYFTFNQSKAKLFNIQEKYLLPCITKSIDIDGAFFTKNDFENLKRQDKFVYLLNVPESNESSLKKYLAKGEADGVHKKFLTASRNPWHTLENRPPSPIWVSVFNRNGLRFIRNEANISNLTTFHCIYLNMFSIPKGDLLFAYLLTDISKNILNDNRREYGNGLQKFEPNDINKALMVDLDRIVSADEKKILYLYHTYRSSELEKKANESLLAEINSIFVNLFKQ